jgi:hypothetical protein
MAIAKGLFRTTLFGIALLMIAGIIFGISTHATLNYGGMAIIAAIAGKWAESLR